MIRESSRFLIGGKEDKSVHITEPIERQAA